MPQAESARVGPNAAIQVALALKASDPEAARTVFARAGLAGWLDTPPSEMIPQEDAARLHRAVREALPPAQAVAVLQTAGRATADYLLGRRIPKLAQLALRAAPDRIAARALSRAIAAHAWTFVGSGRFQAVVNGHVAFTIADNPLCAGLTSRAPLCVWHAAVFERLFSRLVSRAARVEETECCAAGSPCCRFVVRLRANA